MAEYIEREAAVSELNRIEKLYQNTYMSNVRAEMASYCCQVIKHIPAADVVEVRHGRWVWDDNGMDWGLGAWKCSVCHSKPETWWEADKRNPYRCSGSHYCPNCGTKMDGGVNGEHA